MIWTSIRWTLLTQRFPQYRSLSDLRTVNSIFIFADDSFVMHVGSSKIIVWIALSIKMETRWIASLRLKEKVLSKQILTRPITWTQRALTSDLKSIRSISQISWTSGSQWQARAQHDLEREWSSKMSGFVSRCIFDVRTCRDLSLQTDRCTWAELE